MVKKFIVPKNLPTLVVQSIREFCKNGHIVNSIPYHCVDGSDDVLECPYCGTKEFAKVTEWPDEEYGGDIVPYEPIKYDLFDVDDNGFKSKKEVAVYDVSQIENWNSFRQPGACKDCLAGSYGITCTDCSEKQKRIEYGLEIYE